MTCAAPGTITDLKLHNTNMNGALPASLVDLSGVTYMEMEGNTITGVVPALNWTQYSVGCCLQESSTNRFDCPLPAGTDECNCRIGAGVGNGQITCAIPTPALTPSPTLAVTSSPTAELPPTSTPTTELMGAAAGLVVLGAMLLGWRRRKANLEAASFSREKSSRQSMTDIPLAGDELEVGPREVERTEI